MNSINLKLDKSSKFIVSNWTDNVKEKFDLIVVNPPYIPLSNKNNLSTSIIKYEPHLALFGGIDGLDTYKSIEYGIKKCLHKNTILIMEIGIYQAQPVKAIFECNKYLKCIDIIPDLQNIPRCIVFSSIIDE